MAYKYEDAIMSLPHVEGLTLDRTGALVILAENARSVKALDHLVENQIEGVEVKFRVGERTFESKSSDAPGGGFVNPHDVLAKYDESLRSLPGVLDTSAHIPCVMPGPGGQRLPSIPSFITVWVKDQETAEHLDALLEDSLEGVNLHFAPQG